MISRGLGVRVESASQKLPSTGSSQEFIRLYYHAAPRQHYVGHASDFNPLEHRIIDAHVVSLRADRVFAIRIKNHQVRVTAHGDSALARIQAKEFSGSCGNQFHKTVHAESPLGNAA